MTCQAHPALIKQAQWSVRLFQFLVNRLEDPWPMSCRCLEPRWFVGDPTLLARDNIYVYTKIKFYVHKLLFYKIQPHWIHAWFGCVLHFIGHAHFTLYASTRLPSKKIHAPIWSMVALKGNYLFDQNKNHHYNVHFDIQISPCRLKFGPI